MKSDPEHKFENSMSVDDYGHCLICRIRGYFASGEWFHYNQHDQQEVEASKLRHPSQQQPADGN